MIKYKVKNIGTGRFYWSSLFELDGGKATDDINAAFRKLAYLRDNDVDEYELVEVDQ